jgi:hypothetical protein
MIGKKFIAPALPVPPLEYNQREQTDLIRSLRLYFNLLDNYFQTTILDALNGGVGGNGITFPHIAASDSTDQFATATNTPTPVNWDTLTGSYLWTLNAPGSATAGVAGVYKISYSLQFANSDNAIHDAAVWIRVNGANVANTTTIFSINARKSIGDPAYLAIYAEATFDMQVGDDVELYWATNKAASSGGTTGIYLHHEPIQTSPYSRPAIPSARGSITYVSAIPPA